MDYLEVTEVSGESISIEQIDRLRHRYLWGTRYCVARDAAEVACGTGPGLGMLNRVARSFEAGDCSDAVVRIARRHYGERIPIRQFDAQRLPFADASKDVILLFEALYYLPSAERFVAECRRVLRPGGQILVVTANKDLFDFNPSPGSHTYFGVLELPQLFASRGFDVELFGYLPVDATAARQRILRPLKSAAVAFGLMPKTMRGKRLLKRLVFGRLVTMPAELGDDECVYRAPTRLATDAPDRRHKVLYCAATLRN